VSGINRNKRKLLSLKGSKVGANEAEQSSSVFQLYWKKETRGDAGREWRPTNRLYQMVMFTNIYGSFVFS
jgi:hypothetical protein